MTLDGIINQTCADKTDDEKIRYMDKVCDEILQPFINKGYKELSDYMNAYDQKMIMKRESLADKGIFIAKKRYILNVHNSEGVQYAEPKLKVMGLEMVRSSTPAIIKDKLKDSIKVILNGDESKLHEYIKSFRSEFMNLSVEDIAKPSGVNGMLTYSGSPIYVKGTPIHVRGALLFNHHVKRLKLDKKYAQIRDGDKIKFVYVEKPNPFHEDVIAFTDELPPEFDLKRFIDYDKQFEKVFLDAISIIIEPIGWNLEQTSTLDEFF
jgi:DNA polymerase elongation subunit (family B)